MSQVSEEDRYLTIAAYISEFEFGGSNS